MANKVYFSQDHFLYLTTYDDITFSLQGKPDGDFLQVDYDNDTITVAEGADGEPQWSQRVASVGTFIATIQWGADTMDKMHKVFEDQQKGFYLKRAELKRITNTENVTVCTSQEPKILKLPTYTIGTVAADRPMSIKVSKLKFEEVVDPV